MSAEGDVSLIRDEDLLRRMWQQTEDFSRKKEIRAHMYRLREERLRSLYSPEPTLEGKGYEYTSTQDHVKSFADQSFQSMKSKEVRDAGSPPKEFTYRGQDLKELSNAGWNVESENKTIDDGHTTVKSVHANIEGHYDVDGGKGQFAADDHHKNAFTEYDDGNTSIRRNEDFSKTSAHEQVSQQTDDGRHFSTKTSSSSSTAKLEQVSSTHDNVSYANNQQRETRGDYEDDISTRRMTNTNSTEQIIKSNIEDGELISRKVDYPNENTKIIVETRCLPDGTKVTSTRREFHSPVIQKSRSEIHSQQVLNETESTYSTTNKKSDEYLQSQFSRNSNDHEQNIVDSQKSKDVIDFGNNNISEALRNEDFTNTFRQQSEHVYDHKISKIDKHRRHQDENQSTYQSTEEQSFALDSHRHVPIEVKQHNLNTTDERIHNVCQTKNIQEIVEKKSTDNYQTTYQSDYTQRKISEDFSPSHQAWASTLRSDIQTNHSMRSPSPGKRTMQSSNSSIRSSVSPEKNYRNTSSRCGSPRKFDRTSPTLNYSNRHSSTHSTYSMTETNSNKTTTRDTQNAKFPTRQTYSPERKPKYDIKKRASISPEKKTTSPQTSSTSPDKNNKSNNFDEKQLRKSPSPDKLPRKVIDKDNITQQFTMYKKEDNYLLQDTQDRTMKSSQEQAGYMKHTAASSPDAIRPHTTTGQLNVNRSTSQSPQRNSPTHDSSEETRRLDKNEQSVSKSTGLSINVNKKTEEMNRKSENRRSPSNDNSPYKDHIAPIKGNEKNTLNSDLVNPDRKPSRESTSTNNSNFLDRNSNNNLTSETDDINIQSTVTKRPTLSPDKSAKTDLPRKPSLKTANRNDITAPKSMGTESKIIFERSVRKSSPQINRSSQELKDIDFITTEKTTEEINRKIEKDRNRKLITPSTSPTRTQKTIESTSSTGQSSPTTTASGFVYFSSTAMNTSKVTELGDRNLDYHNEDMKPLVSRSSSPSKISCKSPSPEKKIIKENLPRKSSLKKPSLDKNQLVTPSEKPPTSFLASPEKEEKQSEDIDNIITNKATPVKKKPPLERRETYDERCRKILGMMDEKFSESSNKESKNTTSNGSSPSISPCESPVSDEIKDFNHVKELDDKIENVKQYVRATSRETSPCKYHDKEKENFDLQDTSKLNNNSPSHHQGDIPKETVSLLEREAKKLTENVQYCEQNSKSLEQTISRTASNSPERKIAERKPSKNSPSPEKIRECRTSRQNSSSPERKFTQQTHEKTDVLTEISTQLVKHFDGEIKSTEQDSSKCSSPIKHSKKHSIASAFTDLTQKPKTTMSTPSSPSRQFVEKKTEKTNAISSEILNEFDHQTTDHINTIISSKTPTKNIDSPKRAAQQSSNSNIVVRSSSSSPDRKINGKIKNIEIDNKKEISSQVIRHNKEVNSTKHNVNTSSIKYSEETYTTLHNPKCTPDKNDVRLTSTSPDRELNEKETDKSEYSNIPSDVDSKKPLVSPARISEPASLERKSKNQTTIKTTDDTKVAYPSYESVEKTKKSKGFSPSKEISPDRIVTKNKKFSTNEVIQFDSITKNVKECDVRRSKKSHVDIKSQNSEFIISEREQQVLDRVQSSLRRISPDRKDYQSKTSDILKMNIDEVTKNIIEDVTNEIDTIEATNEDETDYKVNVTDKAKNLSNTANNPSSRNTSPNKRTTTASKLVKPNTDVNKPKSFSPRKPNSPTETKKPSSPTRRPQSPQVHKVTNNKSRDDVDDQKPKAISTNVKIDKSISNDMKKSSFTSVKQQNISKTSTTKFVNKLNNENETKRIGIQKGNISNIKKKELDLKITRTSSDISIKSIPKKIVSPQRIKSKPEIRITKQITKTQKTQKEYSKLPVSKPKSATALNTPADDDDIIIDVQLAKSSRESSPDRICPTPVGFSDDVGTPRLPDEVNEPDEEFNRRSHHVIHETESITDNIVEICENEETFNQRNVDDQNKLSITNSHLHVNKKHPKYNENSKEVSTQLKDTDNQLHLEIDTKILKSDECLLSVSEKVNKFAKGPAHSKDKSPCRQITEEYDNNTTFQDDYTKLSVNDKAHLFIETAENSKVSKQKPIQRPKRPDLSDVDESLKSDDCLLSVSDKVTKFVKTAEQVLSDTYVIEEKEKKIREQHDKIMKQIIDCTDDSINTIGVKEFVELKDNEQCLLEENCDDKLNKTKGVFKPVNKAKPLTSNDKKGPVKLTTLRSCEAVKKAKALFENIASTTTSTSHKETSNSKNMKLADISVTQKRLQENVTYVISQDLDCTNKKDATNLLPSLPKRERTKTPDLREKSPLLRSKTPTNEENMPISRTALPITREKSPLPKISATNPRHTFVGEASPLNQTGSPVPIAPPSKASPISIKTVLSRYPEGDGSNSTVVGSDRISKTEKPNDNIPGYQRPTKTSQMKEEARVIEDIEVSTRRGSGKFGVDLRRTSVDRSSVSSERRPSGDHHQPCIEDIYDVELLEQMLEKVVGYEQRRRIRAQIRIAKKNIENESISVKTSMSMKQTSNKTTKTRSPDRRNLNKSPQRMPNKTLSTDQQHKPPQKITCAPDSSDLQPQSATTSNIQEPKEETKPLVNGHSIEPVKINETEMVTQDSEKPLKSVPACKVTRPLSPNKKSRPLSPSKTATMKLKSNRFSEYATAYMKKVGLNESDIKAETKVKKAPVVSEAKTKHIEISHTAEQRVSGTSTKIVTERTSSKDIIEVIQINNKRTPSPEKHKININHLTKSGGHKVQQNNTEPIRRSPDRKSLSPHRANIVSVKTQEHRYPSTNRDTSPENSKLLIKETEIKTVQDSQKKMPHKPGSEETPSWITSRNLKKVTSETRSFSSKKIETEKPMYRAKSPSKTISKPIDVITSSYGPGPLDADGKPLFGIKALRKGSTNYQVKGTVVRQEFHSHNGGPPEGTVSVTAYSTEPEDLERLLRQQGERPSRLHGLAAITTTKRFGGDSGATLSDVQTRQERAAIEQFTHSDARATGDTMHHTRLSSSAAEHADIDEHNTRNTMCETNESIERRIETHSENKQMQTSEKKMQRVDGEREDKRTTVRQISVKSLTEKFIKSATGESGKAERSAYPKAGLILRSTVPDAAASTPACSGPGTPRATSGRSACTVERVASGTTVTTTTTVRNDHDQQRSFLDSSTKVTGVQDILTRMKNADIVIEEGDTSEDSEARALLNKFLGATVLMAGMQSYVTEKPSGKISVKQESVLREDGGGKETSSGRQQQSIDIEQCWDERVLRKLLDESTDYETRRRLRGRIKCLMAEQEACASAVTEALAAAGEAVEAADASQAASGTEGAERDEEEVTTVTPSVRRSSTEQTLSSTTNTKVIEVTRAAPKPVSPFTKFRQLEKQNSTSKPSSPQSPQSPGSPSQPYFKFTDPALHLSAVTIKERLLQWCRDKTRDYENVKLENFSTSWADGLAFCALIHHFLPHTFDYSQLSADQRRHNFTLAFKIADEKAGVYPLLDVDDMVAMRKPDWKCVFTYVQSLHRRFKDER
ncbi:uncharacterized protein LOC126968879 isoform X1 [Leptidea sinapis]|uniref:uncharacterized protein LOC126968879 isoform X1 n=2 Tax=Leptidea sinapis TaxID=189913 RepID=UPI0021C4BBDA|nr:uncharacterized protein LOC126968879 isoform X1 [Leptidea sinapis]XP_050669958.1 uncharacterized protein LOC126968879 isoform X1 [Leptidea sinapis]